MTLRSYMYGDPAKICENTREDETMKEIIGRKEAKAKGLKNFFTGLPCKYGHVSERFTSNNCCFICNRADSNSWAENNPEKTTAMKQEYYKENTDKILRLQKMYRETNPEKLKERMHIYYLREKDRILSSRKSYYEKNAERVRATASLYRKENAEKSRDAIRAWFKANPHKRAAYSRSRFARVRKAIPPWFDKESVDKIYSASTWISLASGIKHHVDHVIPIVSNVVCGLHCADNLQIITALENRSKSNKHLEVT